MQLRLGVFFALLAPFAAYACSSDCPTGQHPNVGGGTGDVGGCCPIGYDDGCCEGDGLCCLCNQTSGSSSSGSTSASSSGSPDAG
jgi:hypothetical protein